MNRDDANLQGLVTYDADKPCRRGHLGKRYVSNGACVQCQADKQRRYSRSRAAAAQGVTLSLSVPHRFAWLLRGLAELLSDPSRVAHHAAIEGFASALLGPAAVHLTDDPQQAPGPDPDWVAQPLPPASALPALVPLPPAPAAPRMQPMEDDPRAGNVPDLASLVMGGKHVTR
jgi:hypothetical protein